MDKKIITAATAAAIVLAVFFISNQSEEITISAPKTHMQSKKQPLNTPSQKTAEELEIKINKTPKKTEKKETINTQYTEDKSIENNTVKNTEKPEYANEETPAEKIPENKTQEYKKYIKTHNYKPLKISKDVTVYVKNIPEKEENSFIPPMVPTVMQVKIENKKIPIVLDTKTVQANKEIFVEKDDKIVKVNLQPQEKEEINLNENEEKKTEIITPPAIGQN